VGRISAKGSLRSKQRVSYKWREWWIYGRRWNDKCTGTLRLVDGRLVCVCQREIWSWFQRH